MVRCRGGGLGKGGMAGAGDGNGGVGERDGGSVKGVVGRGGGDVGRRGTGGGGASDSNIGGRPDEVGSNLLLSSGPCSSSTSVKRKKAMATQNAAHATGAPLRGVEECS